MEKCIDSEGDLTAAHKFEPRYHETSDINHKAIEAWDQEDEDIGSFLPRLVNSKRIYVGDICTRCGMKVMDTSSGPKSPLESSKEES